MKCLNCGVTFELNRKRPAKKWSGPDTWRGFKDGRFFCSNRCRMYRDAAARRDWAHTEMERIKSSAGQRFKTMRGKRWVQCIEGNLRYFRKNFAPGAGRTT